MIPTSAASVAAAKRRAEQPFQVAYRSNGHVEHVTGWAAVCQTLGLAESTVRQYLKGLGGHPLHYSTITKDGEPEVIIVTKLEPVKPHPEDKKKLGRPRTYANYPGEFETQDTHPSAEKHWRKPLVKPK